MRATALDAILDYLETALETTTPPEVNATGWDYDSDGEEDEREWRTTMEDDYSFDLDTVIDFDF